jgi:hypothetical protein
MNKFLPIKFALLALLMCSSMAHANEYAAAITEHANKVVKTWLGDPQIIKAIHAQNEANKGMTHEKIMTLDKTWRAETSAAKQPMIQATLANPLSQLLKKKQADSNGLYTEIFVMDAHGLNVGQSETTSDYWQGDEDKWQQTFQKGADAIHISDVEKDESTLTYQSQLSLPIVDPATQKVIGAITLGINVEGL